MIVLYESQTGHVKQYAEWLAEALDAKCLPLKEAKNLNVYDGIVFGGWLSASKIAGYSKVKDQKNLKAVFAVGSLPKELNDNNKAIQANKLEKPYFYLPGGVDFEKLSFPMKSVLKLLKGALSKKKDPSKAEAYIVEKYQSSYNLVEKEALNEIIEHLKSTL
ncbi:flavodoxin domain-containing protein [Guggenheimella bovis]